MIPKHLQGMSAVEIVDKVRIRAYHKALSIEQYVMALEGMLLLSITHSLVNASDDVPGLGGDPTDSYKQQCKGQNAEGIAIAFLNHVLPYEEKGENKTN